MLERIVVPLDGSMTAEAILPHLRRILHRKDAEVVLVRAVVPPPMENSLEVAEAGLAAAREYLLGKQETLEQAGVRVKSVVRVGSPLGLILDVVEEEKATMIAVATHGASGLPRLLLGSVAEQVLRKSPVPVLVVRPFWSYELLSAGGTERTPIRTVLLPVDGSELSTESLPAVAQLSELFESRVVLLRVLEPKKHEPITPADRADAEAQLRALAGALGKQGVETACMIREGEPTEEILKAIPTEGVDLVAMTTHGRGGLNRAITGSVTERILRQAKVPLLVTRNAASPRGAKREEVAKTAR
jgi:nucleotide-binding universal stress UspA family protein